jgi:endonuclease
MTCREALQKIFFDPAVQLTRDEVYEALDKAYPQKPWKRNTIYLHLSGFSINNPSRRHHPATEGKCFLFWDGDRSYRKWIPENDGTWVLRTDGIHRVGEHGEPEQPVEAIIATEVEDPTVAGPISLSIERDLEESLVQNLAMLERGLTLYRDGDISGRQLDTGAVGIIDLVAVDATGKFVVIELKAGRASDSACGQILGYMSWLRKELAGGKPVRGIIVASEFTDRLRYAVDAVGSILLVKYGVRFSFTDVTAIPSADVKKQEGQDSN